MKTFDLKVKNVTQLQENVLIFLSFTLFVNKAQEIKVTNQMSTGEKPAPGSNIKDSNSSLIGEACLTHAGSLWMVPDSSETKGQERAWQECGATLQTRRVLNKQPRSQDCPTTRIFCTLAAFQRDVRHPPHWANQIIYSKSRNKWVTTVQQKQEDKTSHREKTQLQTQHGLRQGDQMVLL